MSALCLSVFVTCSAPQVAEQESIAPEAAAAEGKDGGPSEAQVEERVEVKEDEGPAASAERLSTEIVATETVATEKEERLRVEARGVWVTRWDFSSAEDIQGIMVGAKGAGFNQVYFQVRGVADAYYRSGVEPWAAPLTGKLGRDPGWDPLAVAIEAAHGQGMELHAWINTCTAWKGKVPPGPSTPTHILRSHPEYRVADKRGRPMSYSNGHYIFLNPALPGVQRHLEAVVADLASFYAIDGLHLDYARYPAHETSNDRLGRRLFAKARKAEPGLDRATWQRRQLSKLIKRLRAKVHEVRPRAMVSAAVTGIYRDLWGWDGVTQGFVDFHQDSHGWAEQGAVDALIPMIYWPPTTKPGARTDFVTLAEHFAPLGAKVTLLAGLNVEAGDFEVLRREVAIAREKGFDGFVLFAWASLVKRGWLERLGREIFVGPALPRPPERLSRLRRRLSDWTKRWARAEGSSTAQGLLWMTALRSMTTSSIQFR